MRISDGSSDVCSSDLPAVKREALADRQLGAHARQHVTVEPGDIAGIVVAVANDANRPTEAEREREAIIGREVHRLSRAAGAIVAEIGDRGADDRTSVASGKRV